MTRLKTGIRLLSVMAGRCWSQFTLSRRSAKRMPVWRLPACLRSARTAVFSPGGKQHTQFWANLIVCPFDSRRQGAFPPVLQQIENIEGVWILMAGD
jgi:hypothetical protein